MTEQKDTRDQILDIAQEFFYTKGYDETSMSDIQERVGIARGTLYYHFDTKEEILDEVIRRQGEPIFKLAEKISRDKSLPVEERLIRTLLAMKDSSRDEEMHLDEVHHPTNALLHYKINQYIVDQAGPFLTDLVREGIEEGIFRTEFPEEVIEMLLIYANIAFDHSREYSREEMMKKVSAFIFNIHRLLGAEQGCLDFSPILGV